MKDEVFHFKQFDIKHGNGALKVNTDAVLLGAMAGEGQPKNILEIGTGNGVIALMLAQRFLEAKIDAVEIDNKAAELAGENFRNSPFSGRLSIHPHSYTHYFASHQQAKFDLIVCNPPFFLHALPAQSAAMRQAKHTGHTFFEELFSSVKNHMNNEGSFWLIIPPASYHQVQKNIPENGLYEAHFTHIFSRFGKPEFRLIVKLEKEKQVNFSEETFHIRDEKDGYHGQYKSVLKNFLKIF